MSTTVKVSISDLGSRLFRAEGERGRAVKRGVVDAARRGAAALVKKTPRYLGQMANSWDTGETRQGAEVRNTAPHAGIVEAGARPHSVSPDGMAALTEWAARQVNSDPKAAKAIAWAIAQRLKTNGQVGHFIARDYAKQDAPRHLREEIERHLRAAKP